jgi:glycosyltransferase involved in cell wall biosynthesis
MKVLVTTDTVGGVWTYAVELARALRPQGVWLALATMGGALSPGQRRQVESLSNVVVHESTFRLEWMHDPWHDVAAAGEWLLHLARQFRPDVVHLNGYAHGALPWEAPVLVAGHSCVLSWWRAVKGEPAPADWDRYAEEVRRGIQAADAVVAPSAAMLGELQRFYRPLPNGRVIHNGRDGTVHRAAAKEPFVLSAGRLWDEAKNLAALDRVAPRLPWPVYVAGDAGGANAAHVRMLGRLDEETLAGWMARAAVYALPAKYEPFGLSALEAALSGCALVLGDIPSLREVWGDAAIFVHPGDDDALRRAVHDLIEIPYRRAELGQRAYQRALRYTPQQMATQYMELYRQLVATLSRVPQETLN